tara:strand:+ start:231 stop:746 length:516 start_codon:yes stop_codon:yes gene_type:complete
MVSVDCFSEIKTKSTELVLYLEHLISSQDLSWQEHFGFDAKPIEDYWIEKELTLNQINKIHPIKQLGLLKIPGKSFYNWHVDDFRQSCINILISRDHHSYSIFGEYKNDYYHNNIIELKYKPYTYYLFNNQKKHSVVNLDSKDRHLLSLYFRKEISYEILREKLKSILTNT